MSRIDNIGQNGNDGEHYEVIALAKNLSLFYLGTTEYYQEFIDRALETLRKEPSCPSSKHGEE